jgi:AbiV family abortive infection protein
VACGDSEQISFGSREVQRVALSDMSTPDLTIQDLRLLAPAAAMNARDLLADAEILLQHQRWPRAHALAVLAGEEAAKAYTCICDVVFGVPRVSRHDLERGHIRKLILARAMTDLVLPLAMWDEELLISEPPTPTQVVGMARQDNEAKKRGLYVDIDADGSLHQPSDIGEAEARNVIASVTDLIGWVSFLTSDKGLELLLNPSTERSDKSVHRPRSV